MEHAVQKQIDKINRSSGRFMMYLQSFKHKNYSEYEEGSIKNAQRTDVNMDQWLTNAN